MISKKLLLHLPAWLFYFCLIDLILMALAVGLRFILPLQPITVFNFFLLAALGCTFVALMALLLLIAGVFCSHVSGKPQLFGAFFLGIAPLAVTLLSVTPYGFTVPVIHDISTDTRHPPEFTAIRSMRQAGDNSLEYAGDIIATKQADYYPDIKPLLLSLPAIEALNKAKQAIDELGWVVVAVDQSSMTIEAYTSTSLFGFIDDVIIRISRTETGSRLDIRSASRLGEGDLGANAIRIRRFIKQFNEI